MENSRSEFAFHPHDCSSKWSSRDLSRFISLANNPLNSLSVVGAEFSLTGPETLRALRNLGHPRAASASTPISQTRLLSASSNRNARWTCEDIDTVVDFLRASKRGSLNRMSMDQLGRILGRTGNAVQLQMERLGLLETYDGLVERIFEGRGDGDQTSAWEMNSEAPSTGKRWTEKEEAQLVKMFESRRKSMRTITEKLGRSSTAIIMHMEGMGLIETRLETARRRAKTFVNPLSGETRRRSATNITIPIQIDAEHEWTRKEQLLLKQLLLADGSTQKSVSAEMGCSEKVLVAQLERMGLMEHLDDFGHRVFGSRGDGNQTSFYSPDEAPNRGKRWATDGSEDDVLLRMFEGSAGVDGSKRSRSSLYQITKHFGRSALSIIMRLELLNCFESRFEAARRNALRSLKKSDSSIGSKRCRSV